MNDRKKAIRRASFVLLVIGVIFLILGTIINLPYRVAVLVLLCSCALGIMSHRALCGYAFTAWVMVCVGLALAYPQWLKEWGGFSLPLLIVPLTQIIMFGMGTTLSPTDFSRILASPLPIILGAMLQFGIMPLAGFLVAIALGFEGELAAGIVLIGSVSGGVASNLMCYIAGANVALSVTMTVVSTFAAPLLTPVMMKLYAGRFIPIDTVAMMVGVLNIIVIPVVAGLWAHSVLYSSKKWARQGRWLVIVAGISIASAITVLLSGSDWLGIFAPLRRGVILGGALISIVSLSKLVISVWLGRPNTWMDRVLPLVSMAGICAVLSIIIAQTHDVLMEAGLLVVLAAIIHNTIGYILGYWVARIFGVWAGWLGYKLGLCKTAETLINEANCRTISIEVGMQNGGMATGLAMDVLRSHIAALPANVFGTWMNISGSLLANWWKCKDVDRNDGSIRQR